MKEYLQASEIIDWHHPDIRELAEQLCGIGVKLPVADDKAHTKDWPDDWAIVNVCFEWVRDEIAHSVDYQRNPVTCCASDVLQRRTGYCFAKSHLLAALLRANHIPAGFCYQRLSIDDQGAPYSLHGFNGVYLSKIGWYRVDARGDRQGVCARFTPPQEQLAYSIQLPEEADFPGILAEPLPIVIKALQRYQCWDELLQHLPDMSLNKAQEAGYFDPSG